MSGWHVAIKKTTENNKLGYKIQIAIQTAKYAMIYIAVQKLHDQPNNLGSQKLNIQVEI